MNDQQTHNSQRKKKKSVDLDRSGIHCQLSDYQELNIIRVNAEELSSDKTKIIQDLQKNDDADAVVGSGVDNAPELATAQIGIAIGSGPDVTKETGGIVLIRDERMLAFARSAGSVCCKL